MKKLLLLVVMVVMAFIAMAQNPKVSYQAVVRDAQNRLVANTSVSVKVEVLNAANTAVYTETQTVTTNANGLMSMLIGGTDEFAAIDWSNAQIKTTVTIDGADVVNTVPVTAVPYALNANYATELDPESASLAEVYAKILTDSTALAEQINNTADAIDARIKADSLEVVALYEQAQNTLAAMAAIPEADTKITTAKINEFIDNVTMDTAMAVFPHVQGMNNDVKAGLKAWVAQVAKNNPTYAMDILTYYIENLTQAQVAEIFGAYGDMNSDAKTDLLNGLAQIIKDNPDIAYDVLNYYIDNVDMQQALSVYNHIHNNMNADVKEGLKQFVVLTVKNNPTKVMEVLTYYIQNLTSAQVTGIFGAYDGMNAQAKSDFRYNMLQILDIPAPEAANNATLTIKQGENTLGTFTADASEDVEIEIPEADTKITTAKINEFIDNVTMDTAMAVFPHVQGMNNDVKAGLKAWVAQVAKNNPTYAMDILTYYIENLTQAQVAEIFGAYSDMNSDAKTDLLNGLAQIIKDNPEIAYDVLNYYIDNVDMQQALSVYNHIHNNMNADVKEGLKQFVVLTVKNNPTKVMEVLTYYIQNLTSAQVAEIFVAYDGMDAQAKSDFRDNMLQILDIPAPEAANNATLTIKQGENTLGTFTADASEDVEIEIPEADTKITTAKINKFIDNVNLDTAMVVFPHVQGMNNDVKTGLKMWVAQVAKNNPTYAMDVLTHYIKNLTPAQVTEIFGAYNNMTSAQAKSDLLEGLATIIKNNPDIAYDVLNNYIDNVDVDRALSVLPHINSMNNDVKTGLKLWITQKVINNPSYILQVLKAYLETPNATTKEEVVTQYAIDHKDVAKNIMVNYLQNGTADDVDALVVALASNTAGGKTQFQNYLNAYIDSRIGTETSQMFTATADQTSFTLTATPKSNHLVRLYINGIMVGDNNTGVISVNGTTVTYNPAQNGGDTDGAIQAGAKVIISYFK